MRNAGEKLTVSSLYQAFSRLSVHTPLIRLQNCRAANFESTFPKGEGFGCASCQKSIFFDNLKKGLNVQFRPFCYLSISCM